MKIIKVIRVFILLSIAQLSYTQNSFAEIQFDSEEHDFGYIYEADGDLVISFQYENKGNEPVVINRVVATSFEVFLASHDSLASNETGELRFRLKPFKKSGYFEKNITVFSNAKNSPTVLKVKGKILHGSYTGRFKHAVGELAFKQSQLNFSYIYNDSLVTRFMPVLNKSEEQLNVEFSDVPSYLEVTTNFESLEPGQHGLIVVEYNTHKTNDWDFVVDDIGVVVNTATREEGFFSVSANIREDFSQLTKEGMATKPKISIPITEYQFDTIQKGVSVFYDFLLINEGARNLDIRALKPTCGCTVVMPEDETIAPGDSTYIKVKFDSEGYAGVNKKGVTVITNDPDNYKQFLWVKGYVQP